MASATQRLQFYGTVTMTYTSSYKFRSCVGQNSR